MVLKAYYWLGFYEFKAEYLSCLGIYSVKKKPKDKSNTALEKVKTKYHAIRVIPCEKACNHAKLILSKVFLINELSQLPLDNCQKMNECTCIFKHFDDRRADEGRRSDSVIFQDTFNGDDHRTKKRSRRRDD
jgi:hypothetical protein